jgi:replicative DNA helicase
MKSYALADRFRDGDLERGVLASIARDPQLYWSLLDLLPGGAFACEYEAWERVREAVESDSDPSGAVPAGWQLAAQPHDDAERLADLRQRRLLADVQEWMAQKLNDETVSARDLAVHLEEEAVEAQRSIRELDGGRLVLASDVAREVLADARARREARQQTGKPVMGMRTGIARLDEITGGLEEGLYLLAAGPAVGKTTLAAQIAVEVAGSGDPVAFATFENSAANLVSKMLCARAGVNSRDLRRGYADDNALASAFASLAPVLGSIAVVEGTGRLTVAELRGRALQMMSRTDSERCLIVVDYLQLWAKASAELRGMLSSRERVETLAGELRQLATRLGSPVLAIVSQNRAQGDYGANGKGAPTLDSLKESGDLEYAADVVVFLHRSQSRQALEPTRAVDLTIAKNRNGETGSAELLFRADKGVMREVAQGAGVA